MRYYFIAAALLLSSCATGYGPKGVGGGYTDVKLEDNLYQVTYQGNGFTSENEVQRFAMQRARQICGENKVEVKQFGSGKEVTGGIINQYGQVMASKKPRADVLFSCLKPTEPQAASH